MESRYDDLVIMLCSKKFRLGLFLLDPESTSTCQVVLSTRRERMFVINRGPLNFLTNFCVIVFIEILMKILAGFIEAKMGFESVDYFFSREKHPKQFKLRNNFSLDAVM